jgi:hypothetical protein
MVIGVAIDLVTSPVESDRRSPVRRRRRILVGILAGTAVLGLTFVLGLSTVAV